MKKRTGRELATGVLFLAAISLASCGDGAGSPEKVVENGKVKTLGSIEVTARLVEVPEGAIFKRDLYNYATVLEYQVLRVHRGQVSGDTIYVGHYNPFKPRAEAADKHVKVVGGNLKAFRAGELHRMALEVSIDDHYMGGIINKYFGRMTGSIYWAVWTDLASEHASAAPAPRKQAATIPPRG